MPNGFYVALQVAYLVTLAGVTVYALLRGGSDERIIAAAHLTASLASGLLIQQAGYLSWLFGAQQAVLAVDLALLAVMLAVSLHSRAWWPLWATGFHLDTVLTHVARLAAPQTVNVGYALVQGIWAYPLMAALWVGTYRHAHDARTAGRPEPVGDAERVRPER